MTAGDIRLSGLLGAETAESCDGVKLSRRAVFSLGAGLSALAFLGLPAVRTFGAERLDIRYVLTDRRFAQSVEFGSSLSRHGSKRLEVTDGLTQLWLDALVPLWREKEGAIAGLTLRETWVCIAEQARSCRRRSILVARHTLAADGNVMHAVSAPSMILSEAAALTDEAESWPRAMARLVTQCPTEMPYPSCDRQFQTVAAAATAPSVPLVSWIIA